MSLKSLMDSFKKETVLLGPVQRHLLAVQQQPSTRRQDVIHPSELVASDFCPRAVGYRLLGRRVQEKEKSFQLDVIFAAGHGYHDKWQNWAWEAGILRGRFRCLSCGHGDWELLGHQKRHEWTAVSPEACESCGAPRRFLTYGEVPVAIPELRIAGHADGDLAVTDSEATDPVLEVKSIGDGTVRFSAPRLVSKHTKRVVIDEDEKTWTDWQALWRDIRRPFTSHRKQAAIYATALGRNSAVFIYEYKPTGAVKEFRVDVGPETVAEELDLARQIVEGVEEGAVLSCAQGRKGCEKCLPYEEQSDEAENRPEGASGDEHAPGDRPAGEEEPARSEAAPGRVPRDQPRRRSGGVERQRRDRGDADVHSLGGLLDRAGRARRDERGDLGAVLPSDQGPRDARRGRAEGAGPASEGRSRVVRRGGGG